MQLTDTEDEQLEQIKAWWAQYGKALMAGITIGAVVLLGWGGWKKWQDHRDTEAALAFHQVEQLMQADKPARATEAARKVASDYSGTPYAALALLLGARAANSQHDLDKAALFLQDLIAKTKQPDIVAIARLRLARVQWAQGKNKTALATLQTPPSAFAAMYAELRGDILGSEKKWPQAYAAYAEALKHPGPDASYIRMKQSNLPYSPAAAGKPKNGTEQGAS